MRSLRPAVKSVRPMLFCDGSALSTTRQDPIAAPQQALLGSRVRCQRHAIGNLKHRPAERNKPVMLEVAESPRHRLA